MDTLGFMAIIKKTTFILRIQKQDTMFTYDVFYTFLFYQCILIPFGLFPITFYIRIDLFYNSDISICIFIEWIYFLSSIFLFLFTNLQTIDNLNIFQLHVFLEFYYYYCTRILLKCECAVRNLLQSFLSRDVKEKPYPNHLQRLLTVYGVMYAHFTSIFELKSSSFSITEYSVIK